MLEDSPGQSQAWFLHVTLTLNKSEGLLAASIVPHHQQQPSLEQPHTAPLNHTLSSLISSITVCLSEKQRHVSLPSRPPSINPTTRNPETLEFMSIENLKTFGESSSSVHMQCLGGLQSYRRILHVAYICIVDVDNGFGNLVLLLSSTMRVVKLKANFIITKTPSPKPTKIQERPSSRRITYTFVSSVSAS